MAKLVTKETTDTQTLDTDSQDHGKTRGRQAEQKKIPKHLKQEQEKGKRRRKEKKKRVETRKS